MTTPSTNSAAKKPMRQPFAVEDIPLDLLNLDLRNSRFPRDAQSQDDAFELMLNTAGDSCLDMLKDLTRFGHMNSSDIPIVILRNERYVMMEGNRRLTCLRLWSNPTQLKQHTHLEKKYLSRVERLVEDSAYNPPATLRVAIAPNEADADIWIERKHAGGSGGAGTVEWGSAMKDRRRARNNPTKASRTLAFVELVSNEYKDEPDILVALEEVRSARYTFIQRFVDRSIVREMVGLDFSEGKMTFRHGAEQSLPIIRQVLTDFARPKAESGRTWARELDTVDDFRNYLNKHAFILPGGGNSSEQGSHNISQHASDLIKPTDRDFSRKQAVPTGIEHSGDHDSSFKNSNLPDANDSRPLRPTTAQQYIFRGIRLDNFTPRIQEIVRQTSLLNVQRQNEITSVMLRVILDLASYQFLISHDKKNMPRDLDKRLKEAIKIIDPQASNSLGPAENTSPLRKAFHETTADSIKLTQYAVHDIRSGRTPAEVLTLADRYTPVLIAMNNNMGGHPIQ